MKKMMAVLLAGLMFSVLIISGCNGEKTGESESAAESLEEGTETEAIVSSNVNFRKGPGTDYESIGIIPATTLVTVLGEENGFYKVLYQDMEGYVSKEYLTLNAIPVETVETEVVTETQTETAEETTAEETTAAETAAASQTAAITKNPADDGNGNLTSLNIFSLEGLPNKSIPYGCSWDSRDETGMPTGVYWYESLYGQYYGVYRIKTDQKIIYLTMDEGYEAGYTPTILDTLKEKNVKAVFFVTKQFVTENPELVQRMIDEGHIIGNHTCRHPSGGYPLYVDTNGIDSFTEDICTLHKMVYDQFGYSMKLFRFPEGEASELTMAQIVNLGYTPVYWSYAHLDYDTENQPAVETTLERCLTHMGTGSIYLLHAVSSSNTAALGDFIDQARAQGYEFGVFPVEEVSAR